MTPNRLIVAHSYEAFIEPAADFLRSVGATSEAILLAPTRGAADDLARRACPKGALGLHRMTMHQLAAGFATPRMVAEGKAPASRLSVEALMARVTHTLRSEGKIPYFAPVSSTPGFSKALATTLTEMRLEDVSGKDLRATGDPGRDLSALLALYETALHETALADLPALLRLAISAVTEGKHRLTGLPLLLVDPPCDSALSREFLSALISRSPRVFAATLAGDEKRREILTTLLGANAEQSASQAILRNLDRVRVFLFAPQAPLSDDRDESLDYFSAAGEGMECVEICRRIRKLGVPFDQDEAQLLASELLADESSHAAKAADDKVVS
jgi:hypothetical protein